MLSLQCYARRLRRYSAVCWEEPSAGNSFGMVTVKQRVLISCFDLANGNFIAEVVDHWIFFKLISILMVSVKNQMGVT